MQPQSYVQIQCPMCGAAAWGHPSQAVPCGTCGRPIAALAPPTYVPPGMPQGGAQGWQQPPPIAQAGQAGQAPAQPPGMGNMQPIATQQPAPGGFHQPAAQGTPAAGQAKGEAVKMSFNVGGFNVPFKLKAGASTAKIIGVVVIGVVLTVVGVIVKTQMGKNKTEKGNLSYSSLSMDPKKVDPDAMITAVGDAARKWKKDAIWWSINLQKVKADGTVDVTGGGAQVVYISQDDVQSKVKKTRDDSVKKFNFGPAGVDHKQVWGATDPWEGVSAHETPQCSIKQVIELLKKDHGLADGKAVRVTFDPQFAKAYAWRVIGEDPKLDLSFSWADCAIVP